MAGKVTRMTYSGIRSIIFLASRHCSQKAVKTGRSWQALKYGSPEDLQMNECTQLPVICNPMDVLIKVHAASVNPIDVMMLQGYGSSFIGAMRQVWNLSLTKQDFPLTFGRDFSGTVIDTGRAVKDVCHGDKVWGVVGPQFLGTHSDYVIVSSHSVFHKPKTLGHTEAASVPYAALTAWSALSTFGEFTKKSAKGKRALVLGASGGVGTIAVQLLKAWGAEVSATCSTDAVGMVQNLGADFVIDYKLQDVKSALEDIKGFDIILDNVGGSTPNYALNLLKMWQNSKYVTIVSPLLRNMDHYGIPAGTVISLAQALQDTAVGLRNGRSMRWAYIIPNRCALKDITKMADNKEITPVIDKVFQFQEMPEAYKKVLNGHLRGKVVIVNETE